MLLKLVDIFYLDANVFQEVNYKNILNISRSRTEGKTQNFKYENVNTSPTCFTITTGCHLLLVMRIILVIQALQSFDFRHHGMTTIIVRVKLKITSNKYCRILW